MIKKPLGSVLHFLRRGHSCAGILKALKLSSIILVSKEVLERAKSQELHSDQLQRVDPGFCPTQL